jgi:hypothetical protein
VISDSVLQAVAAASAERQRLVQLEAQVFKAAGLLRQSLNSVPNDSCSTGSLLDATRTSPDAPAIKVP